MYFGLFHSCPWSDSIVVQIGCNLTIHCFKPCFYPPFPACWVPIYSAKGPDALPLHTGAQGWSNTLKVILMSGYMACLHHALRSEWWTMRILVQESTPSPTHLQLNFKNGYGHSKATRHGKEVEEQKQQQSWLIVVELSWFEKFCVLCCDTTMWTSKDLASLGALGATGVVVILFKLRKTECMDI